jgi:hypothetical protein
MGARLAMSNDWDWADGVANEVLRYLDKCQTMNEERELIAAYLRQERSRGQMLAGEDFGAALGIKTNPEHVARIPR